MKVVVVGGSGLIGRNLIEILRKNKHDVFAASPSVGVNSVTGEGLAKALEGAQVTVDVSNSPSFADAAVLEFFDRSTRNLLKFGNDAGVSHHVALSIVGADRLPTSGYMRAKIRQEELIFAGPIDFSIIRATQFFEFLFEIAAWGVVDGDVRLSPASFQPIAAIDVATCLAEQVEAGPLNGSREIAGPQSYRMAELVAHFLKARHKRHRVVSDWDAPYFGAILDNDTLMPGRVASLGSTDYQSWLADR